MHLANSAANMDIFKSFIQSRKIEIRNKSDKIRAATPMKYQNRGQSLTEL